MVNRGTIAYTTQVFAPVLTFTVFSVRARDTGDKTLDTARVFTALSLFALLSEPLASLVMALATFLGAVGSFARIQEFLQSSERVEQRVLDNTFEQVRGSGSSQSSGTRHDGDAAISVQAADFGWDATKPPLLSGVTLSIPPRKFTMIIGPVGSGKSLLLQALLGEVPALAGSVRLASSSVAYCAQTPWHTNGTVREAIVGAGADAFDATWYARVVHACALRPDLERLPLGDASRIGSGGIALSGGQSQRLVSATVHTAACVHVANR